ERDGGHAGAFSEPDSLLACLLLAGDLHALRALARAGVGLRVLAADREATAVAQAPIATDLLQPLDVLRALAAQITLDDVAVVDDVAQPDDLFLGEVAHLAIRLDPNVGQDPVRGRPTDAVDIGQADLDAL